VQNILKYTSLLEVIGCTLIVCLLGHDVITVRFIIFLYNFIHVHKINTCSIIGSYFIQLSIL